MLFVFDCPELCKVILQKAGYCQNAWFSFSAAHHNPVRRELDVCIKLSYGVRYKNTERGLVEDSTFHYEANG